MQISRRKFTLIDGLSIIGFLLSCLLIYFAWRNGVFESRQEFVEYVRSFGSHALFLFLALQTLQLFLPMLPSALTCTAGVILFGTGWGIFYNYIGISLGSIIAFLLVRRYGEKVIRKMVPSKKYDKYKHKLTDGHVFERFFTTVIFLPFAPDNLVCYMAGLSNMSAKKVIIVILLGKPLSIALYSLGITRLLELIGII